MRSIFISPAINGWAIDGSTTDGRGLNGKQYNIREKISLTAMPYRGLQMYRYFLIATIVKPPENIGTGCTWFPLKIS